MDFAYTVVATTFNDSREIVGYLENMCRQKLKPREIIIADGGSKDNTAELIEEFAGAADVKVRLIKGGRLNISEGYNTAIKAVRTEFVGVTGIGNVYDEDYFQLLANAIVRDSLDAAYSPIRGLDANSYSKKYNATFLDGDEGSVLSIASNHGVLLKTEIFEDLGYFYEKFVYAGEDAEFYALVRDAGYKTGVVKEAISLWRTPLSRKEFFKQTKNYMIGNIQIHGKEEILKQSKRDIEKVIIELILIVLFIAGFAASWWVSAVVLLIMLLYFGRMKIKNRHKSLIMILQKRYLSLFYLYKNRKYSGEEYRVRR